MAKKLVKLTFPSKLVKKPVTFQMAKRFNIMPNLRRAKVTETVGVLVLELDGKQADLEKGIKYLIRTGVKVEPIVGSIIE